MTQRRVVISGAGVVSAFGLSVRQMFEQLVEGRSAVRHLSLRAPAGDFEVVGAAVEGEPWGDAFPRGTRAMSDRAALYALLATKFAISDSGLTLETEDANRIGVAVGTSLGGAGSQEDAYARIFRDQSQRLPPYTLVRTMYNGAASQIGLANRLNGPNLTYTTTCSSSSVAIGEAFRLIQRGDADVMIAGGTEAPFALASIQAWRALQVLAPECVDDPSATCRPFNADRNGTVLGDGAAFVILEEMDHAKKRGALVYAEIAGYGLCNDSMHMMQPSVEAQARAMQLALKDGKVSTNEVDYINAHGTGTPLNDLVETQAVKHVFCSHARQLKISSTKSMHGHLVGAAGALECVITAYSVRNQIIPPTAHLRIPDPNCDLDYVPLSGRHSHIRAALTNSFAVGGTAASLLLLRH